MFQKFKDRLDVPISEWTIEYRVHATRRMFEREIEESDILLAIENGIIIEDYGNDYPFPSVLVSKDTENARYYSIRTG